MGDGLPSDLYSCQCVELGVGSQHRFHRRSFDSSDSGEYCFVDQVDVTVQESDFAYFLADAVGVHQSLRADCHQHDSDVPDRCQFQLQCSVKRVL